MRRYFPILITIVVFALGLQSSLAQDPWQQIIPRMSFGYGGLLSVYWSPINGQIAAASESGFQFYNESMLLEGERRFDEPASSIPLFSPDMRYVAIEEYGGLIIRDTETWKPLLALGDYAAPSWSPNSQYLAIWARTGLQIWDIPTTTIKLEVTELISNAEPIQWSPDSAVFATPGDGAIIMARADTGEIVRIHPFAIVDSFDWSADGQWLAVIGVKDPLPLDRRLDDPDDPIVYELMRVDALTGEVITRFDLRSGGIEGARYGAHDFVSISPNGRYVAATLTRWEPLSEEQISERWTSPGMGVWNFESGSRMHDFSEYTRPLADTTYLSWSPHGDYFATSNGNALQVYDAVDGTVFSSLQAYIVSTNQTEWTDNGQRLVAAGGLWDVSGTLPQYVQPENTPFVPDIFEDTNSDIEDYPWLHPSPYVYDYDRPPYEYRLLEAYPDIGLLITHEIDIEYPGTPEYEDEIDPEERYIVWDIATHNKLEEWNYIKLQTAWLYDLNPTGRDGGNTPYNVVNSTRLIGVGDDEIVDLRTAEKMPLQDIQRWEWREVWFSPDGAQIMAYDNNGRFKAFDPMTGEMLYETVPAERYSIFYTADLSRMMVTDSNGTLHVYETNTGELLLSTYTANTYPLLLWSEDRNRLAIGGDNRAILIYDIPSQTRVAILRGHRAAITSMDWNPDCDFEAVDLCNYVLASSDENGQVIIWGSALRGGLVTVDMPVSPSANRAPLPVSLVDYSTMTPLWAYVIEGEEYGRDRAVNVEWGSAGIRINNSWYYDHQLNLLDNEPVWTDLPEIADDNGTRRLVLEDGTLLNRNGDYIETVGYGQVFDAAFSADGSKILTAENDGGHGTISGWIREWSADSGQYVLYWGGGHPGFNHIETSPNGQWYATATIDYYSAGGRGQIWFADRYNTQYSSLIGHTDTITELYWYGENVITSSLDGSVRLWDIHTGLQIARWYEESRAPIVEMQWMPDGDSVIVSTGGNLVVLDASTLNILHQYEGVGGGDFDFSPDQTQIVTVGPDSVIRIIDVVSDEAIAQERRHMPYISDIEWNPDGRTLAVARHDGSLVLLDGITGNITQILRPEGPEIRSISWNPAGDRLLVDVLEGNLEILDPQTGVVLTSIENHWRRKGAWWNPDGTQIAFGTYPDPNMDLYHASSLLYIHDAETGQEVQRMDLNWADYSWFWEVKPFQLEWSPDGEKMAAFYGGRVRVWDTTSGTILADHTKIERAISLAAWEDNSLAFWTPNGEWRLDVGSNVLTQVSAEGLALNTYLRPDQKVVLSSTQIMDFATLYPLQQLPENFSNADWHPSCWTEDCDMVLAVATGSQITMYGY